MFSLFVLSEPLCLNTEGLLPSIVSGIGWESGGRITTVSAVNTNYSIITTEIPIQYCFPLSLRLCLTIRSGSKCFPCYPEASHQPTMNRKAQSLWCLWIISHMSNPFSSSHKLYNAPPFEGEWPFFTLSSPNNPFVVPWQHFSAPVACGIPPLIAQNWVCNLFLHPISWWGIRVLLIIRRKRKRQEAQMGVVRLSSFYLTMSPCLSPTAAERKKVRGGDGGRELVTKPIIFTFLPLLASRHVIFNGLGDPGAGFEPAENTLSQMKLSEETACVQAFQSLLTCQLFRGDDRTLKTRLPSQILFAFHLITPQWSPVISFLSQNVPHVLGPFFFFRNEDASFGVKTQSQLSEKRSVEFQASHP